jgi:flagellar biosynthesis chaperone FliJ
MDAMIIPVVAIAAGAGIQIAKVFARTRTSAQQDPATAERLSVLEEEVGQLRRELSETHERLEFTERLLAQHRTENLSPPK